MADRSPEISSLETFSSGDHQEIPVSKDIETGNEGTQNFEGAAVNKTHLEERLRRLQTTMGMLRTQLAEERYMWKKQLEEATHGTALLENQTENLYTNGVMALYKENVFPENNYLPNFLPNVEYESSLTAYQEDVIRALAAKRANLRRQISINNYKRRLLEVENMCNLELLRVKQSVQFLQPLQMMASEWNTHNTNENNFARDEIPIVTEPQEPSKDYMNNVKVESAEPSNTRFLNDTTSSLYTKSSKDYSNKVKVEDSFSVERSNNRFLKDTFSSSNDYFNKVEEESFPVEPAYHQHLNDTANPTFNKPTKEYSKNVKIEDIFPSESSNDRLLNDTASPSLNKPSKEYSNSDSSESLNGRFLNDSANPQFNKPSKDYSNKLKIEDACPLENSNNRFVNDTVLNKSCKDHSNSVKAEAEAYPVEPSINRVFNNKYCQDYSNSGNVEDTFPVETRVHNGVSALFNKPQCCSLQSPPLLLSSSSSTWQIEEDNTSAIWY